MLTARNLIYGIGKSRLRALRRPTCPFRGSGALAPDVDSAREAAVDASCDTLCANVMGTQVRASART